MSQSDNGRFLSTVDRTELLLCEQAALRRRLQASLANLAETRAWVEQTSFSGAEAPAARDSGTIPAPPARVAEISGARAPAELKQLTSREIAVLRSIADGQSTKEVAFELGITFKTASCHRANIMKKLKAREVVTLVRIAIRNGLVQA